MAVNPVDGALRVVAVALDAEVVLAVVGEVAVLVGTEAVEAGTLGGSARVRKGQSDRGDLAVDDVQGLEAGGGLVLGGEADAGGLVGATDYVLLVTDHTGTGGMCGNIRMRISCEAGSAPMRSFSGVLLVFWNSTIDDHGRLTAIRQNGLAAISDEGEGLGESGSKSREESGSSSDGELHCDGCELKLSDDKGVDVIEN